MTEPTYTFVKGQGWVPAFHEQVTFSNKYATWTLTARTPEEGELYGVFYPHSEYYVEDGKMQVKKWAETLIKYQQKQWTQRREPGDELEKNAFYVVVEYSPHE